MSPPVRDDDQLRPLAAARAHHPGRADREQGARRVLREVKATSRPAQRCPRRWPSTDVFPPLMINMTRAGEVGGFLDVSAAARSPRTTRPRSSCAARSSPRMTYPVVVFVMAILPCIGMLLFIVPVFADMFADLGGELPLPTQILVFLIDAMKFVVPLLTVLGIVGLRRVAEVRQDRAGPQRRRPAQAQDPGLRRPLPEDRARAVHPQLRHHDDVRRADPAGPRHRRRDHRQDRVSRARSTTSRRRVRRGESVSGPLPNHPVFPPMVVQMMAVGEDTGALDTMLHKIADFYDQEVEATTEAAHLADRAAHDRLPRRHRRRR